MNYPSAYCVRCKENVNTHNAQTVVLANKSRALTGNCPKCRGKVYHIMPKKKESSKPRSHVERSNHNNKSIYKLDKEFTHEAFCVRCRKKTKARYAHGVVFQNGRKAIRGQCAECGTEAYKILNQNIIIRDVSAQKSLNPSLVARELKLNRDANWIRFFALLVASAALGAALGFLAGF